MSQSPDFWSKVRKKYRRICDWLKEQETCNQLDRDWLKEWETCNQLDRNWLKERETFNQLDQDWLKERETCNQSRFGGAKFVLVRTEKKTSPNVS